MNSMEPVPENEPIWFKKVNEKLSKLLSIDTKVTEMQKQFSDMSESLNFAVEKANKATDLANKAMATTNDLRHENENLKQEVSHLHKRILQLEAHSRCQNLIFEGLSEKEDEKYEKAEMIVQELLQSTLELTDIKFDKVYRLGRKRSGKTRPILVKLQNTQQRDLIWTNRFKLKDTNIWIYEDFPKEIKENRDLLLPVYLAARRAPQITSASLKLDQLFLNGKLYTAQSYDSIPDFLKPHNSATIKTDNVVVFASKHSVFSNLHELDIMIDGHIYNSNEQFIQFSKATLFKDHNLAQKILEEKDPYQQMKLGKETKDFKKRIWHANAPRFLNRVNREKYAQHQHACQMLLDTGSRILGEGTKDPIFGIGLNLKDKTVTDASTWTGQNLMGHTLMDIRNSLKKS